jgi:hypothetical protein
MTSWQIDRNMHEERRPRVIAGFGRSGTTWVQDVLAESNSLRAVFEPLHPRHIRGAAAHAHRFLSADDDDPELRVFLQRFFFENFHSLWADYRVSAQRLYPRPHELASLRLLKEFLRRKVDAKRNISRYWDQRRRARRLVKFVRANMMLGWIRRNFDARIVFIVRHPAAVILSQLKSPNAWHPQRNIERYRSDWRLLEAIDDDARTLLHRNLSDVEALTVSWCIENTVAMRQAAESGITVVYYETLVQRGRDEWHRILSALCLDVEPHAQLIDQPSQQAWGEKAGNAELVRQFDSWMGEIDGATATGIQGILDAAGVGVYSVNDPLPSEDHAAVSQ